MRIIIAQVVLTELDSNSFHRLQTNQPKLLGASIFSPDDIYLNLKKLKAALPRDVNGALYVDAWPQRNSQVLKSSLDPNSIS